MDIRKYSNVLTYDASREMNRIYEYITEDLYAEKASKDLMNLVESKIENLKYNPKIYVEIEKFDDLKKKYRRIVIKNFIILYTINEIANIIYISHRYYGKRNYLK